ncbi:MULTISPECIES: prephenate/arogenate dehydrogenase [Trichocoleus]|uniref:Prephenate/arogenate dehydrogenase n=1 Tax=Trichocoleus desertorum GB2-A4 TaxID=2933944 RepID=A0ABV0J4C3_9CYAN|nr:prephenate/arogenate dehydrogenase [Trichocoleus sp. FACHB-46]MBD1861974.1 prephenate/arogenate dehydrogenase [Trichocoleus sp. FACHB-46]
MNIGIVGLGLIGGSLGLDLRSRGYQVLGVSRQEHTCQRAIARGAVDDASVNLTLLAAADVVFICTPLSAIEATVIQLIPHLAATTILTDVGSVKTSVVDSITPRWSNFVGGHPMAGTAENGIEAAQSDLFAGKPYVLTPTASTPPVAIETLELLVRSLGAHLYHCRPEDHDRAVAWISHLPVMVSSSLIAACMSETDPTTLELAEALASSGFKDTSRVGGGNPELGLMMARYNRSALLRSLAAYRDQLDQIVAAVEQENWDGLVDQLKQTQQGRSRFVK